jgi:hypothetical protein
MRWRSLEVESVDISFPLAGQGSQPWVFAGRIGDNQQTQLWSPNCTISIHILSCFWLR